MATVLAETVVVGSIGRIYELRRTPKDDRANIDFSIAVTPRRRNSNNEWEDGDTTWHNVKAWGRLAENIEKSLKSGDRVIVKGYISLRKGYTKDNGEQVPDRNQLIAEFVGIDLTFDSAQSDRKSRGNGNSNSSSNRSSNGSGSSRQQQSKPAAAPAKSDDGLDDLDFSNSDLDLDFGEAPF